MADSALISTLRTRRQAAGIQQRVLARQVGVSRQAIGAIESGQQVPSTALALLLARALGCTVDDLFRLPGGPTTHARLAAHYQPGERVVAGRVDGEIVAHRWDDPAQAADGLILGSAGGEDGTVELLGPASGLENNVLVAGCAPLLGLLADRLGRRFDDARGTWLRANSSRSLTLLEDGLIHIAGIHLAGAQGDDAHIKAARRAIPGGDVAVITLARWEIGLVVAAGNPLAIRNAADVLRNGVRVVTREAGAGAQQLFDKTVAAAGGCLATSPNIVAVAGSHSEVARRVRWGLADVGIATESTAIAQGLGFVPLSEERFDLLLPQKRLDVPAVARFLDLVDGPAFQAEASRLPGYDLSTAGDAITVAAE